MWPIPIKPEVGVLHDEVLVEKYKPGTQLEWQNCLGSLFVFPWSQGKGIGKSLMKLSNEKMKEKGVVRYVDSLSSDSARLVPWMREEGMILDYCRVLQYRQHNDFGDGKYGFILSDEAPLTNSVQSP